LEKPVGIYFISEDIFTMASYYMEDMQDSEFFPEGHIPLDEKNQSERKLIND